jgi:mitochondrial chaperone BCS1
MIESFLELLRQQLTNQVFAGGLALGLTGFIVAMVHRVWPVVSGFLKRLFVVTAVIDSRNGIFESVIKWLNELPYSRSTHFFAVTQEHASSQTVGRIPKLLYSPAPGFHMLWRGWHLVWINRSLEKDKMQVIETLNISMLFARRSDFERLIDDIVKANYGQWIGRTQLYMPDSWADEWRLHTTKPKRALTSVVLPIGVRDRILEDIRRFHESKARYEELGIPWRRGYLLYGPPGTGKTSLVFALAGALDLNICTLSLTHRKLNDQNLADMLQGTPPQSIILLEDVDAFFQAREKQDAKMEISFSGLLNAIDGVAAQEGRVVFMTTNHRELLDPALIRPGRIDVDFELGNSGKEELRGMVLRFFPDAAGPELDEIVNRYREGALSPAQIQQLLQEEHAAPTALASLWGAVNAA